MSTALEVSTLTSSTGDTFSFGRKACGSYLDSVPEEVLDGVLRFCSRLPYAMRWEPHIPLMDIVGLYGVSGELGRFLKGRFTTLCVSKSIGCIEENEQYGWEVKTRPMLWTDEIDVAYSLVKAGGGKELDTLIIGQDMCDEDEDGTRLVDYFLKNCNNLSELSISEAGRVWDSRYGKRLKKLEISSNISPPFPCNNSFLRELNLHSDNLDMKYTGLWRSIGSHLVSLTLKGEFNLPRDVRNIQKRCRNLTYIRIEGRTPDDSSLLSDLLASYGGQLKYAYLYNMNEEQIKHVAAACTNARFYLWEASEFTASLLSLLGSRVDGILTGGFSIDNNGTEWKNAWGKCIDLKEIDIYDCQVKHMDAIMATPKSRLRTLRLSLQARTVGASVKKVMNFCAEGTSAVEKLSVNGPKLHLDDLKKFVETNKTTLASITLYKKYDYHRRDKKVDELLRSFLQLPALEELRIDCMISKQLRAGLQKRGVYAAIPR